MGLCGLVHKGIENCSMPGKRCEVGRHTLKKLTGRSVISHVPLKEGSHWLLLPIFKNSQTRF